MCITDSYQYVPTSNLWIQPFLRQNIFGESRMSYWKSFRRWLGTVRMR